MIRGTRLLRGGIICLGSILLFAVQTAAFAQEPSLEGLPGLRERAVIMHINSRIVEQKDQNQEVAWSSENSKITIPGKPVVMKIVGDNLVVAVQFTPFLRKYGRYMLVAQGQIWIQVPGEGISYHTTIQTLPVEFGAPVLFFPLGSMKETTGEARIEIQLVLEPYSGDAPVNSGGENIAPK